MAPARPVLGAVALALLLAGCAETGDFGRPKPNLWNETTGPLVGKFAATAREEPVSWSMLTDDEQELRKRAWHFLMPNREQWGFEKQLADLAAKRVIPADLVPKDSTAYFGALKEWGDRSPRSRYQRLREDIDNDRQLLGSYIAVACRVEEMDAVRIKALDKIDEVTDWQAEQARNRVAENEALTAWVLDESVFRLAGYRYALQHLVIESPDRDAVKVERTLTAYAADRVGLERCGRRGTVKVEPAGGARYHPRPDKPEKPPK
ncbi:hypothetical protein [Alsobacter sp. R-9]